VLRFAQHIPPRQRPEYRYSPELQIALDPSGRPLIETMDKDVRTKRHSDGDEGPEEEYDWEELVPRTLVTNDATAVRRFHAESGPGLICKVFGSNIITENGTAKVVYTHRLDEGDLANLHNVGSTAHQFQDWVHDKHHEARVIVVGDRIFPVLIHASSATSRIDWRTDYSALRYEIAELPVCVESGVRCYMAAFGLAYAAFDFAIDATGKRVFLEANTAGQYGFLETHTGAAIGNALADLLAGGAP
jgi:glutathione synthase/RimK-type ligase-like ATP-grasp enzyme